MPRPRSSDHLQGFRFHARTSEGYGSYTDPTRGEAGFNSITLPEISADAVEYKEGWMTWTEKLQGPPTVSNVTLSRGVTKSDLSFYTWMMQGINGGNYRTTLDIYHWPADGKTPGAIGDLARARIYRCHEAFPTRCKLDADLDATSGDVSMQEIDVEMEWFEPILPAS